MAATYLTYCGAWMMAAFQSKAGEECILPNVYQYGRVCALLPSLLATSTFNLWEVDPRLPIISSLSMTTFLVDGESYIVAETRWLQSLSRLYQKHIIFTSIQSHFNGNAFGDGISTGNVRSYYMAVP
jgi:hypothetical protein